MHERLEVLRALVHLIGRDAFQLGELAAGLLAHLTSQRALDGLAVVDATTREQPGAGVRTRELLDEEHAAALVDAGNDRGQTPRCADAAKAKAGARVGASARAAA